MTVRFQVRSIDDAPRLLEKSYRLRYQVYCLERRFLRTEHYPDGLERDQFDDHSVHVGVIDERDELIGTARLVGNSGIGLPLMQHCTLFPQTIRPGTPGVTLVEVSRLAISRHYRRRHEDLLVEQPDAAGGADLAVPEILWERRRGRDAVFLTLIKGLYQAAKRIGATHWMVATERSLQRRMVPYGLPFELAGPETDYLGLISPYIMSLAAFDRVILGGQIAALDDFLVGLEPAFAPVRSDGETAGALRAEDAGRLPADGAIVR